MLHINNNIKLPKSNKIDMIINFKLLTTYFDIIGYKDKLIVIYQGSIGLYKLFTKLEN